LRPSWYDESQNKRWSGSRADAGGADDSGGGGADAWVAGGSCTVDRDGVIRPLDPSGANDFDRDTNTSDALPGVANSGGEPGSGRGDAGPVAASGGGGASGLPAIGLPATVVLGYENLDPFQWAALMSHYAPGQQRPQNGAQESVLPQPKW